MQVSIESADGLNRSMTVAVPAERIDNAVKDKLQQLSRSVRLSGFRPGKVPIKVIEKRFGQSVRMEIVEKLLQSSYQEAIMQEKLRPAGGPEIEPLCLEPGKDLEYRAKFEVYPELGTIDVSGLQVEKTTAEIGEQEIKQTLEKLQQQNTEFSDVEREAQDGDQVTVDFTGYIDGEKFAGGEATDIPFVIGAKTMLADFEQGVLGCKAGDEKDIEVSFPEDYHGKEVAGKTAKFTITVKKVAESKIPEVDDEFAKKLGFEEGLDKLKEKVQGNLEQELEQLLKSKNRDHIMEVLYEANKELQIPQALVKAETDHLMKESKEMQMRQGIKEEDISLDEAEYKERAQRRVALGLILSEIVQAQKIKASPDRVRQLIENMAANYPNSDEFVRWYYSDKSRLAEIESVSMEEQVVDWILENAQVTEKQVSFDDLSRA